MLARNVVSETTHIVSDYKQCNFTFTLRTYIMSLPKHKVKVAAETIDKLVLWAHSYSYFITCERPDGL